MLAGGFHELFDVYFEHGVVFRWLGLLSINASYSMDGLAERLLRERSVDVTGLDIL